MQTKTIPFLNINEAKETLERLRIRFLQLALTFIILSTLVITFTIVLNGETLFSTTSAMLLLSMTFGFGLFILVSRGQFVQIVSTIVISYLVILSVYLFIALDDINIAFVLLSLSLLLGALLSERIAFWIINTGTLFTIIGLVIATGYQAADGDAQFSLVTTLSNLSTGLVPLIIAAIARYFLVQLESTAIRAQRAANLLTASADIGRNVSEMLELNVLLDHAVEIIRDRFAFYHVSIFLVDDNESYAHLSASTGEVGERMLARGHRLPVNSDSIVGRTSQAREVIIARDTDADSRHSFNELLPLTRSELAVPIVDNDGIVGVLDMQSRQPDAFTTTEIDALSVIASQLATAIRNARLFEDKERSIRENKRLFIEAETNLREIQRLNRQLTKQAWTDYLQQDRRIDGVTLSDDQFSNTAEWSEEMIDASRRRRAISDDKDGKRTIAVPIELRGEVVGAIELETKSNTKKDDLVDMVRTVSQSLAVSLDNARLFEESNEATAQEQRIGEIVSQYQAADSVDELLRVTLQGLAETLGAEQASIRLGAVPDIASSAIDTENPDPQTNGGKPDVS